MHRDPLHEVGMDEGDASLEGIEALSRLAQLNPVQIVDNAMGVKECTARVFITRT